MSKEPDDKQLDESDLKKISGAGTRIDSPGGPHADPGGDAVGPQDLGPERD